MECPDCKTANIPEALFCTGCGRPLKAEARRAKTISFTTLTKPRPTSQKGSTQCSAQTAAKN